MPPQGDARDSHGYDRDQLRALTAFMREVKLASREVSFENNEYSERNPNAPQDFRSQDYSPTYQDAVHPHVTTFSQLQQYADMQSPQAEVIPGYNQYEGLHTGILGSGYDVPSVTTNIQTAARPIAAAVSPASIYATLSSYPSRQSTELPSAYFGSRCTPSLGSIPGSVRAGNDGLEPVVNLGEGGVSIESYPPSHQTVFNAENGATRSSEGASFTASVKSSVIKQHIVTKPQLAYFRSLRKKKSDAKFICEICGQTFTRNFNRNQHVNSHRGVQNHSCGTCERRFGRLQDRKRHERDHCTLNSHLKPSGTGRKRSKSRASTDGHVALHHHGELGHAEDHATMHMLATTSAAPSAPMTLSPLSEELMVNGHGSQLQAPLAWQLGAADDHTAVLGDGWYNPSGWRTAGPSTSASSSSLANALGEASSFNNPVASTTARPFDGAVGENYLSHYSEQPSVHTSTSSSSLRGALYGYSSSSTASTNVQPWRKDASTDPPDCDAEFGSLIGPAP